MHAQFQGCVTHFRSQDPDSAIQCVEDIVASLESYPAYAPGAAPILDTVCDILRMCATAGGVASKTSDKARERSFVSISSLGRTCTEGRAVMSEPETEDPEIGFRTKIGTLLEVAAGLFKAGQAEGAIEFLANAVELCEENPVFALRHSDHLGTSLQQVVHGFVANAFATRGGNRRLRELLARVEAVQRSTIH